MLDSNVKMMVLQLTQSCNFRCSYCVYSDIHNEMQRTHSSLHMDFDTAKRAVDFLNEHSVDSDEIYISFYGGEPLVAYTLLKDVVEYAKKIFVGKRLVFSMTTNGTFLTKDVVDFLYENEINFMLSLDGPKEIQNINRRFYSNGEGSFDTIKKNMKYILDTYPDYFEKLSINMVIDQQNDYDEIEKLFYDPVFSKIKMVSTSFIDDMYSIEKTFFSDEFHEKEEHNYFLRMIERITNGKNGNSLQEKRITGPLADSLFENMEIVADRIGEGYTAQKMDNPAGACIPGEHKFFVDVHGDFYPCERVNESVGCLKIGDLKNGFDIEKIKNLTNIGQLTASKCKECWAYRFCSLCVKNAVDVDKVSPEFKESFCEGVLYSTEESIRNYLMLYELGSENIML